MHINFNISSEMKEIKIKVPVDGRDEQISRSAMNVLRGERNGYLVYANNKLFSICEIADDLNVEFFAKITNDEFNQFNKFIKNINTHRYLVWDLHDKFVNSSLKVKEEVHLMETNLRYDIGQKDSLLNDFNINLFLLENIYSDSFNISDKKKLRIWINELNSESWFSINNIYIVGYNKPGAFLILRERSLNLIEIFLFGITSELQGNNLSEDIFSHLLYLINDSYGITKTRIQIWVHKSNKIAYRLYEKHNFKTIRIRKKYLVNL